MTFSDEMVLIVQDEGGRHTPAYQGPKRRDHAIKVGSESESYTLNRYSAERVGTPNHYNLGKTVLVGVLYRGLALPLLAARTAAGLMLPERIRLHQNMRLGLFTS